METLGNRLRNALELRQKKQADLVKDLEIPKSAISQYVNGTSKNMDIDRLNDIANYLRVNPAWLMGYDVEMSLIPDTTELTALYEQMTDEQKQKTLSYMRFLLDEEGNK